MTAGALSDQAPWRVICLCAAWCGVCREWRPALEALTREQPDWRFAWVDVEDEDEAMGDLDIQTFPTVLIAQGGVARFLGPVAPSAAGLQRLVAGMAPAAEGERPVSTEAQALLERLQSEVLPRALMG